MSGGRRHRYSTMLMVNLSQAFQFVVFLLQLSCVDEVHHLWKEMNEDLFSHLHIHDSQPTSTNTACSHVEDSPLAAGQRPFCDKLGGAVVGGRGKI